ncbi:ATP-binding protein [Actinomadura sp. HBU206391]|uniref:ATP-binding protein n=1 Tax=Actinomadura sp. HBU206391 TaxID=2731692 RepID=UPI0016503E8B|nr:ATP-binding protein [Actinomadura sp. HBU206391]MBC6457369.1 ATP-binding protein [Actinomadura sp. HBU206391]
MLSVAFWCLAVCAVAVGVLLVRQWRITARLRRRVAVLQGAERVRDEELRHLVAARLPALVEFIYDRPVEVPGPLHAQLAGTAYGQSVQTIINRFAESVEQAKARADQSAKATLKAAMRTVQSLANEQQLAISNMQDRHDDPNVLEDLLKIDHMNAQLGRRAQATAVLCGSWPGQQRSASLLTDVVRGATSRIRDYLRIQVHSEVNVAVVSRVVEPVVLAVAELLDNGARHSQPNSSVQVNFQQTHNGIAIVIDDAGVAMNPEELAQATRLLSGRESVDINRLGDPPQVGFGVVGVLAARYGFSVSVDTRSPYGGVRAVVFLPTALLTAVKDEPEPVWTPAAAAPSRPALEDPWAAGPRDVPEAAEPGRPAEPTEPAAARPVTAGGLPKRRRTTAGDRSRAARPARQEAAEYSAPPPGSQSRTPRETAAGMGAWQRGTRSGRATVAPDSEGNPPA